MQIKTKLFLLFSDAGRGHCGSGWCRMLCKVLPAIRPCLTFHERATQVNIFKLGITTVFSRAELRGITFFFFSLLRSFLNIAAQILVLGVYGKTETIHGWQHRS
ncbi:unnamed protein product [Ixodes persulcatus]